MDLITVDDYMQAPIVPPDFAYRYGDDPNQFGELFLPESDDSFPVIIMLHGGCWREQYGLKPIGSMCRTLADEGFAVWNIEYRRAGNGGDYPNMFLDVAHAADYLRTIADKNRLNLDHVLAVGHSAGGQLALWLAGRKNIPTSSAIYMEDPLPIHGVVSLAGVADLVDAIENDICEGGLSVIMGGDNKAVPEHYQAGSPRELLPLGIPQTHIIGEHDNDFMDNVKSYFAAAEKAGDQVDYISPPDAGHFEIVTPTSKTWQIVRDAILAMSQNI